MKYVWIFILFILAACTVETAVPAPTPLSTQANLAALSTIPVARPTSITEVTETAVNFSSCLPGETPKPFSYPNSPQELDEHILNHLNEGGTWEDLLSMLAELHIEANTTFVDFNNDGNAEIILYTAYNLPDYYRTSYFQVFQCLNDHYTLALNLPWGTTNERVVHIADLTHDGFLEVIIEWLNVTTACSYGISVIGWQHDWGIVEYTRNTDLSIGCLAPKLTIEDTNNDNIKEIVVQGFTIYHQSLAIPREIVQTLEFTGQSYQLASTKHLPSEYRIHVLDDAQRALDMRDFTLAIQFYDQAAHDESLEGIASHLLPPHGQEQDYPSEYQRAFALFRLSILQYIIGESENSAATMAELDATFPEGSIGHEFTILAHLYMEKRATGRAIG